MKNLKISLLAAGATLSFMACSSLEVSNPTEENFPADWSVVEYINANPDLRALQLLDQVKMWNDVSGNEKDDDAYIADSALVKKIAVNYAGFTEANLNLADKDVVKYLKRFNMYGIPDETLVFDTLTLDTLAFSEQFVSYGKIEGRPYRMCASTAGLVKKGDCQATEESFVAHLYCSDEGVAYCLDCDAVLDECPEVVDDPVSSSSVAPVSSASVDPESSSVADESSSSAEAPESSSSVDGEGAGESSSSAEAPAAESSSSEAGSVPENQDPVTE